MKNIHILPTGKASNLLFEKISNRYYTNSRRKENTKNVQNQNIYITSDEEIKEESLTKEIYVIDIQNGNIGKLTCKNIFFKGSSKLIGIEWKNKQNIWNYNHIKEIILTTDQDLIKDGVQAIDDEFLEWFVNNPSCEEVEVKSLLYNSRVLYDYKIIIPKEEPKQETLEEAGERLYPNRESFLHRFQNIERKAFTTGAKWQSERMYSEEEVKHLMTLAFEQGFKKADVVEAGLEAKETDTEVNWIFLKHKK